MCTNNERVYNIYGFVLKSMYSKRKNSAPKRLQRRFACVNATGTTGGYERFSEPTTPFELRPTKYKRFARIRCVYAGHDANDNCIRAQRNVP